MPPKWSDGRLARPAAFRSVVAIAGRGRSGLHREIGICSPVIQVMVIQVMVIQVTGSGDDWGRSSSGNC
jgi:hypothetical protein